MPKGDKFIALTAYLEKCGKDEIKMSFSEIERFLWYLTPFCMGAVQRDM